MIGGGRHSLTTRLTALFAAISTLILLLLGLSIGELVDHHFEELDLELLHGKIHLIQSAIGKIPSPEYLDSISKELDEALVGHHGLSVVIKNQQGRTVFSNGNALFPDALFSASSIDNDIPLTWTNARGKPVRGMSALAPTQAGQARSALVGVATEMTGHEDFMASFRLALWASVSVAALLTGVLGWLAAKRGLAPLKRIRERAADITANRLHQRLEVAQIPVELAEVAETINGMLARLEDSFRRLSEFSSDLAHELRTPVTNLLTQTQVILSKPRDSEVYRDVLASNAEELERLSRIVADMLFLAKAENHLLVPHKEKVDLREELGGLLEFYEVLIEEKNIRIKMTGEASIEGDRLMLRRAFSNLLSNAIRHTQAGGLISILIELTDMNGVQIALTNTGQTIAPEHLPRIFDRFYRADASRQHSGDGAGLGLPIVKSIVETHGGGISVASKNGLTTFFVALPMNFDANQ
jgi:two-component system heavy metal sensor histidine kinase CusS